MGLESDPPSTPPPPPLSLRISLVIMNKTKDIYGIYRSDWSEREGVLSRSLSLTHSTYFYEYKVNFLYISRNINLISQKDTPAIDPDPDLFKWSSTKLSLYYIYIFILNLSPQSLYFKPFLYYKFALGRADALLTLKKLSRCIYY